MRAPRTSSMEKPRAQMRTLTRKHMVVIEDDDHIKTMDENMKWMKLTHLLSFFSLPYVYYVS